MLVKVCNQVVTPIPFSLQTLSSKERRVIPIDSKEFRYLRFRAIGCSEVAGQNGNHDSFPYGEFENDTPGFGYKSFINKRAHVEHNSASGLKGSIGDLPDAFLNKFSFEGITIPSELSVTADKLRWDKLSGKKYADFRSQVLNTPNQRDGSIEVLMRIDTNLVKSATIEPKTKALLERIVRMVDTGQRLTCSMGANVRESRCSVCGNLAQFSYQYCFVPGTSILMSDYSIKYIEDIEEGDVVIDAFGNPTKVIHTFAHKVDEMLQSVRSRTIALQLVATANHPFLVKRRGVYEFVPLKYVHDREDLFSPIMKMNENEDLFKLVSFSLTDDNKRKFIRLLGYFAAEGSFGYQQDTGKVSHLQFTFGKTETHLINDVKDICKTLTGKDLYEVDNYHIRKGGSCSLRICNTEFAIIVKGLIDGTAYTKKLSLSVMQLPFEYLLEFIGAYIDGDGYAGPRGQLDITSVSENLITQVYYILTKLGLTPALGKYKNTGGPANPNNELFIYRLSIGYTDTLKLKGYGFKVKKASSVSGIKGKKYSNYLQEDGLISHKALSINYIPYKGIVYNFETESGSYVANNTSVHNCEHLKPTRKGGLSIVSANQVRDLLDKDYLRPEWLKHLVTSSFDVQEILKGASNKGIAVRNVELNHGVSFFELSVVATPAYPDAIALEKLARQQTETSPEWIKRLASTFTNDEALDLYAELQKRGLISNLCQVS